MFAEIRTLRAVKMPRYALDTAFEVVGAGSRHNVAAKPFQWPTLAPAAMVNVIMAVLGGQQWAFSVVYFAMSAIGLRWVADFASCVPAKLLRLFAGGFASKSKLPVKPIQLYQYEGAPFRYCSAL